MSEWGLKGMLTRSRVLHSTFMGWHILAISALPFWSRWWSMDWGYIFGLELRFSGSSQFMDQTGSDEIAKSRDCEEMRTSDGVRMENYGTSLIHSWQSLDFQVLLSEPAYVTTSLLDSLGNGTLCVWLPGCRPIPPCILTLMHWAKWGKAKLWLECVCHRWY